MKYCVIVLFGILGLFSCKDKQREVVMSMFREWEGKELYFPSHSVFTIQGRDTVDYYLQAKKKIVVYVDSTGCTSCKLQLPEWKKIIQTMDSLCPSELQFLFYFTPKEKQDIQRLLLENRFDFPICIDKWDSINIINKFPKNANFHTFLCNEKNEVMAIGNPVHNLKVRELYLKIIQGREVKSDDEDNVVQTIVDVDKVSITMGDFEWQKEQKATFTIKNIGDKPLAIEGVDTSCGCISVEYSKEPVRPGMDLKIFVIYKADYPEHFSKTVTVHCNSESSPIILKISGDAK